MEHSLKEFSPKKSTLAIQIAMAGVCTIIGVTIAMLGIALISGTLIAIFCGAAFIFLFDGFRNNKVVLFDDGFIISRFCKNKILWSDVKEFEINEFGGNVGKYLLHMKFHKFDDFKFKGQSPEKKDKEKIQFGFVGFENDVEEIVSVFKSKLLQTDADLKAL